MLSDTPYLAEITRQGDQLLPLLRGIPASSARAPAQPRAPHDHALRPLLPT